MDFHLTLVNIKFVFDVPVDASEIIHSRHGDDGKSEYYVHYLGCKYFISSGRSDLSV